MKLARMSEADLMELHKRAKRDKSGMLSHLLCCYETMFANACDENSDTLEFKPEILNLKAANADLIEAMELACEEIESRIPNIKIHSVRNPLATLMQAIERNKWSAEQKENEYIEQVNFVKELLRQNHEAAEEFKTRHETLILKLLDSRAKLADQPIDKVCEIVDSIMENAIAN